MSVVSGPATAPSPMSPLGEKNSETANGRSSGPVCVRPSTSLRGPHPPSPEARTTTERRTDLDAKCDSLLAIPASARRHGAQPSMSAHPGRDRKMGADATPEARGAYLGASLAPLH